MDAPAHVAEADPAASATILAAIEDKRAGARLDASRIHAIVASYVAGRVPDYQMASFLATVACRGLDAQETAALTCAYLVGGSRVDLRGVDLPVVDKHSTGGVGDKVTLVVAPTVAACGLGVVKMSGRGLGFAGGTIDKLQSIEGLRLDLGPREIRSGLQKVGLAIACAGPELAPGDHATYGLRDVTATVDCIPLIAASIVSKKAAVGADGLVLDVKVGAGGLVRDLVAAQALSDAMQTLARDFGLSCRTAITDMSRPLGRAVGNALEVSEALAALRGEPVPGLREQCAPLARLMLQSVDDGLGDAEADARVTRAITSGAAYERFLRFVEAQGGDPRLLERPDGLPQAPERRVVRADRDGFVAAIDPRGIGVAALRVGAGRLVKDAAVDPATGVVLAVGLGERVMANDVIATIHHRGADGEAAAAAVAAAIVLDERPPEAPPHVHRVSGLPLRT